MKVYVEYGGLLREGGTTKQSQPPFVKLPAHTAWPFDPALRGAHGPEYIEWASGTRSGQAKDHHKIWQIFQSGLIYLFLSL